MNQRSCLVMIWHTFLSIFEIMYAHMRFMFFKKPIVTIFGGHKLPASMKTLKKEINEIAYQLVLCDLMIMTGGGSGVMHQAHQGSCRADSEMNKGPSCIGISVKGLDEPRGSVSCQDKLYMTTHTFAARKWILMRFSKVFFFFPGGFGTLDEFMEVMTLLKVQKLDKRKIVLYDKAYWQGFLKWSEQKMVKTGFSEKKEMDYFVLVDSVDEAVKELRECCSCK